MPDVREVLERKLHEATVPEMTFQGFLRRRQRAIRRQRLVAGAVAVIVAVGVLVRQSGCNPSK